MTTQNPEQTPQQTSLQVQQRHQTPTQTSLEQTPSQTSPQVQSTYQTIDSRMQGEIAVLLTLNPWNRCPYLIENNGRPYCARNLPSKDPNPRIEDMVVEIPLLRLLCLSRQHKECSTYIGTSPKR
jgi:hypothetical protein